MANWTRLNTRKVASIGFFLASWGVSGLLAYAHPTSNPTHPHPPVEGSAAPLPAFEWSPDRQQALRHALQDAIKVVRAKSAAESDRQIEALIQYQSSLSPSSRAAPTTKKGVEIPTVQAQIAHFYKELVKQLSETDSNQALKTAAKAYRNHLMDEHSSEQKGHQGSQASSAAYGSLMKAFVTHLQTFSGVEKYLQAAQAYDVLIADYLHSRQTGLSRTEQKKKYDAALLGYDRLVQAYHQLALEDLEEVQPQKSVQSTTATPAIPILAQGTSKAPSALCLPSPTRVEPPLKSLVAEVDNVFSVGSLAASTMQKLDSPLSPKKTEALPQSSSISASLLDWIDYGRMLDPDLDPPVDDLRRLSEQMKKLQVSPQMRERSKKDLQILSDYQVEANQSVRELIANAIDSYYHKPEHRGETTHPPSVKVEVRAGADGKGVVSVSDQGVGMGLDDVVRYLLTPHRSRNKMLVDHAQASQGVTGRFGQGFFSNLALLKTENDFLEIHTRSQSSKDGCLKIKIHRKNGELVTDLDEIPHSPESPCQNHGTQILMSSAQLDESSLRQIQSDAVIGKFKYNQKAEILLNEAPIRSLDRPRLEFQADRARVKVFGEPQKEGSSKISVLVNGVVIQEVPISGVNLYPHLVVELPEDTPLTSDRSTLDFSSPAARDVFKGILKAIDEQPEQSRLTLINSFYQFLLSKDNASSILNEWIPKKFGHWKVLPAVGSLKDIQKLKEKEGKALVEINFKNLVHSDLYEDLVDPPSESLIFLPIQLTPGKKLDGVMEVAKSGSKTFVLVDSHVDPSHPLLRKTLVEQARDIASSDQGLFDVQQQISNMYKIPPRYSTFKNEKEKSLAIEREFQGYFLGVSKEVLRDLLMKKEEEEERQRSLDEFFRGFYESSGIAGVKYQPSHGPAKVMEIYQNLLWQFTKSIRPGALNSVKDKNDLDEFFARIFPVRGYENGLESNKDIFGAARLQKYLEDHPSIGLHDVLNEFRLLKAAGKKIDGENLIFLLSARHLLEPPKIFRIRELRYFGIPHLGGVLKNETRPVDFEQEQKMLKDLPPYLSDSVIRFFSSAPVHQLPWDRGGFALLQNALCGLKFSSSGSDELTKQFSKNCVEILTSSEGVSAISIDHNYKCTNQIINHLLEKGRSPRSLEDAYRDFGPIRAHADCKQFAPYLDAVLNPSLQVPGSEKFQVGFSPPSKSIPISENLEVRKVLGRDSFLIQKEYHVASNQNPNEYSWVYEILKNANEANAKNLDVKIGFDELSTKNVTVSIKDDGHGVGLGRMSAFYIPNLTTKSRADGDINFGWGFFTLFKYFDEVLVESKKEGEPKKSRIYLTNTDQVFRFHEEQVDDASGSPGTEIRARKSKKFSPLEFSTLTERFQSLRDAFSGDLKIHGDDRFSAARGKKEVIQSNHQVHLANDPSQGAKFNLVKSYQNAGKVCYNGAPLADLSIVGFFPEIPSSKKAKFESLISDLRLDLDDANLKQLPGRSGFVDPSVHPLIRSQARDLVTRALRSKLNDARNLYVSDEEVHGLMGYDYGYNVDRGGYREKINAARGLRAQYMNSLRDSASKKDSKTILDIFSDDPSSHSDRLTMIQLAAPIPFLNSTDPSRSKDSWDFFELSEQVFQILEKEATPFLSQGYGYSVQDDVSNLIKEQILKKRNVSSLSSDDQSHLKNVISRIVRPYFKQKEKEAELQAHLARLDPEFKEHTAKPASDSKEMKSLHQSVTKQLGLDEEQISKCTGHLDQFLVKIGKIMGPMNSLQIHYYSSSEDSMARARQGQSSEPRVIEVNLVSSAFKSYCQTFAKEGSDPLGHDLELQASWINTLTHEWTHTEESAGAVTHTNEFFKRQQAHIFQVLSAFKAPVATLSRSSHLSR
ncbi:MAG: ATP-binding protein [Bdellovibrionia bacterium]